jgi:LPPG:FO 2-phospho-L-lactate transferase
LADLRMITVLAGGVGAARFLQGLTRILDTERLAVIANTGDDLEIHGLHVSPDLDTLTYTLAGLIDEEKGWGLKGDTFNYLQMMERYGQETWFRIGDRDLATHILRTSLLKRNFSLTEVTREVCRRLGVQHEILPMTDDPVRTVIHSEEGVLGFQEYFVKRRFEVEVKNIVFKGCESARPSPSVLDAIRKSDGIVFAPSNPIVSIGCILSIKSIREAIDESRVGKVAISPLIAGKPVRGPADRMMRGLGVEPSALGIASIYKGLIDTLVIDKEDSHLKDAIQDLGMNVIVTETRMDTLEKKTALAETTLRALRG